MCNNIFLKYMKVIAIQENRACGKCTACCSGVLTGEAYGKKFWRGRPCHFMGDGSCTIYEHRPENPCKTYECGYKKFDWLPEWMRPDKSNVIVTERVKNGVTYLDVVECNSPMRADVLSLLFMAKFNNHYENIIYEVNGGKNYIGSQDFIDMMENDK